MRTLPAAALLTAVGVFAAPIAAADPEDLAPYRVPLGVNPESVPVT